MDLAALAGNLRSLAPVGEWGLDARADAYGHGLSSVARVARAVGASALWVSDAAAAAESLLAPDDGREMPPLPRVLAEPVPGVHYLGAAAYGLDPGQPTVSVLTLVGEVVAVKSVPGGSGVSYGYSYRTAGDTTLALVGLGYADGVPRLASNRARVSIRSRTAPLVGRVAMDQFVVDLGPDHQAEPGDEAVLFGTPVAGAPSAIEWAGWTERSALDLTAGLGSRIRREAIGEFR